MPKSRRVRHVLTRGVPALDGSMDWPLQSSAFDLSKDELRRLDRYGRTMFGPSALVARKLLAMAYSS